MWLLLLEAFLALAIFVLIVGWTMWPKRRELKRERPESVPAGKPARPEVVEEDQ